MIIASLAILAILAALMLALILGVFLMLTIVDLNTKVDALAALVAQLAANQPPAGHQAQLEALGAKLDATIASASAALPTPAPAAPPA